MLQDKFVSQWGIWFCFQGEVGESNENYYQNFVLTYTLSSPADLAYLWNHHNLKDLTHFFPTPQNKQNQFQVNGKWRKVNSVEFFKQGIEPKWGGRFVFPVNKTQQNKDQLYSQLVFFLIGQSYDHNEHVNGFRIISPKNNQSWYRVEIWVGFNEDQLQLLKHYQTILTSLFEQLKFDSQSVKFLNNQAKEVKETRENKEGK